MESIKNFFDKTVPDYFQHHPGSFGWLLIAGGLLIVIGCICNWNWVLESDGRVWNMNWIINTFGRKAARIYVGLLGTVLVVCGVLMYIYYPHKG